MLSCTSVHWEEKHWEATLGRLTKTDSSPNSTYWYRGQSQADWKLIPSLARPDNDLRSESHLIERFKQNATLLRGNRSLLMIGSGLPSCNIILFPTRLLDWSESPLVGLYFALSDIISGNEAVTDGALWVLNPVELNGPHVFRILIPYTSQALRMLPYPTTILDKSRQRI